MPTVLLRGGLFALAYLAGFCLSAPQFLLFVEYTVNSFNVNDSKLTLVYVNHLHLLSFRRAC